MRKYLVLVLVFLFATACVAADFSASFSSRTGDVSLDMALRDINIKAKTPAGAGEVKIELRQNLSLSDREIVFLSKRGYTLAEIYYLALLAKKTGKKVNDVAALHSRGVGWGVLAKRLGVRPSDLNKLRVQQKKQEKIIVREKVTVKEKSVHPKAAPVRYR